MMTARNYLLGGVEYMVIDDRQMRLGYEAVALLLDRRAGVGADRLLVFHGSGRRPAISAFAPNGCQTPACREDYLVMALYMRDTDVSGCSAELAHALGDTAIIDIQAAAEQATRLEFHITEAFRAKLRLEGRDEQQIAC